MNPADDEATEGLCLWTIGHSNHDLDAFLALLQAQQIEVLVDVRSYPRSQFAPHFNSDPLRLSVEAAGIRYAFFGDSLGGRPEGAEFYDDAGHVLYNRVAESGFFQTGLARLLRGAARHRVALMCSEENPSICHRRLLITRVLAQGNVADVRHIRGDGRVISEESLAQDEAEAARKATGGQVGLFDDAEEIETEKPWRSLLSVLPAKPPRSSSGG